jgi:hypothetical protein
VLHFEECGHLVLRSVDTLFSSAAQVVTNSLFVQIFGCGDLPDRNGCWVLVVGEGFDRALDCCVALQPHFSTRSHRGASRGQTSPSAVLQRRASDGKKPRLSSLIFLRVEENPEIRLFLRLRPCFLLRLPCGVSSFLFAVSAFFFA